MKIFHPFFISIFFIGLISCSDSTTQKGLTQGIIEYEITYPETGEDIPFREFMPQVMLFKFKDNQMAFEMNGPMNMVKTTFIADTESKKVLHLIKLMNNKFATEYTGYEINSIDDYQNILVKYTDETKIIAGYDCQKAIITFRDDENTSFEIFYTNHLKINTPNWSTPYKNIDGVLMQFRLKRYNLTMDFTAKKVKKATFSEDDFQQPEEYKTVTKEEVRGFLKNPF
jgi:GLPGLI family protein